MKWILRIVDEIGAIWDWLTKAPVKWWWGFAVLLLVAVLSF